MTERWQTFNSSENLKERLVAKLGNAPHIFPIASDPLLGALVSCLGLQYEMGNKDWDRLSHRIGIDLSCYDSNPWQSELITFGGEIGIRLWIPEIEELQVKHRDWQSILHPLSISKQGYLNQLVILPAQVARNFAKKGLELVIVKDWVVDSFLCPNPVNYQLTNMNEIKSNSARLQAELMANRQVAFSGTHDLADHLLGGNSQGFEQNSTLYDLVGSVFDQVFTRPSKNISLVVSYLVGVILDDMAQPYWYASTEHSKIAELSLQFLESTSALRGDLTEPFLPQSFHKLVENLRDSKKRDMGGLSKLFHKFEADLRNAVAEAS